MSKKALIAALVVCTLFATLMIFTAAFAQTIPKPSIPEFTVQYIYNSNYVQPTTTIDPYTGETITQNSSYTQSTPIIKITITNQPLTNKSFGLFYQVRVKGHFSQNWTVITYWDATAPNVQYPTNFPEQYYASQYTVLQYHDGIPSNGQLDFQVQAGIGTITNAANSGNWLIDLYQPDYVLNGELSGWSNIQTLTIQQGSNSTAASPNPTAQLTPTQKPSLTSSPTPSSISTLNPTASSTSSPSIPEFSVWIFLPLVIVASVFAVLLRRRNKKA